MNDLTSLRFGAMMADRVDGKVSVEVDVHAAKDASDIVDKARKMRDMFEELKAGARRFFCFFFNFFFRTTSTRVRSCACFFYISFTKTGEKRASASVTPQVERIRARGE